MQRRSGRLPGDLGDCMIWGVRRLLDGGGRDRSTDGFKWRCLEGVQLELEMRDAGSVTREWKMRVFEWRGN